MFLPTKVWLLLQITLSLLTSSFAFASTGRPITIITSVTSNPSNRGSCRHYQVYTKRKHRMSRAYDHPQNNCHHHHHHGQPLMMAFNPQRSTGRQTPASYQHQHSQDDYRRQNRSKNDNNKQTSSYYYRRSTTMITSLQATNRGGDQSDISPPTSATSDDDSDSSSLTSQLSNTIITSPLTNKLNTIVQTIATSKKARGRATLLLVAFLYGTLNVTLRAIYATEGPPAASVLSLVRQCLSIVSFAPLFMMANNNNEDDDAKIKIMGQDNEEEESGKYLEGLESQQVMNSGNGEGVEEKVRPMILSALELAFWNFGAQGLINAGLLSSPAARASFLTQTSVVMTPLISALAGESIKSSVWGGCGVALFGLFLISTSSSSADMAMDSTAVTTTMFNQGDVMILLGALSWSAYIFRTSKLAKSYSELNLQFTKTALLAVMYLGWFLSTALSALSSAGTSFLSSGWVEALTPLWSGWNSPVVWLLLAYSAVGPGAVADLLQQQGQKETSASESNIILCMESVFAAVCAFAILGEVSSMQEMVGGMLIVVAAILASK